MFRGAEPGLGLRVEPEPFDPVPRDPLGLGALEVDPFPPAVGFARPFDPLSRALAGVGFRAGRAVPPVPLRLVVPALGFDEEAGLALVISRSVRSDFGPDGRPDGPLAGMPFVPELAAGGGPATIPLRNNTSWVPIRMALENMK